jgi:hypothetical protein
MLYSTLVIFVIITCRTNDIETEVLDNHVAIMVECDLWTTLIISLVGVRNEIPTRRRRRSTTHRIAIALSAFCRP